MLPEDELQLTKKRLQNLRVRKLNLQQLAVRVISRRLTFFRTNADQLEKLKSLPGVLRDKILQVLMKRSCLDVHGQKTDYENFENLTVVFPLLLSSRTRYIELNGILSFSPDRCRDGKIDLVSEWCVVLLKQIAMLASEVETLVIKQDNPFYMAGLPNNSKGGNINHKMVQSLMKMRKLNRLTVNLFYFTLNDLLEICKNLPRLQYINVGLLKHRGEDRPSPEEISSSFCNLKELIFDFPSKEWLGSLCTRNLPNIEVVEHDPNQIMNWTHVREYGKRYRRLDFQGASNLRSICVDHEDSAEGVQAMPKLFPNVTCLMVNSAYRVKNVMPKYNNIRQFHIFDPYGSEVLEMYLITYGQNLQSLYLRHDRTIKIDLELIFKFCPKLEKLSLLNVRLKTPSSKMEFFAKLKELEWANPSSNFTACGIRDSDSMVLSNIMSAPNLEKVKLETNTLDLNDLWDLNSLIRKHRILNKLHTLHVCFNYAMHKSLTKVLKSACASLPKLTDFKFVNRCRSEDPLLARFTAPNISHMDAYVWVFENEK